MEQLVTALPPRGAFGALLRACRHQALLSQEQLAARAELSERTVRDLEAGRVRSPRTETIRLLADALRLTGPQRDSWFAAAQGVDHLRAGPATPEAGAPARMPADARARPLPGADSFGSGNKPRWHRPPEAGGLACADWWELAQLRRENGRLREEVEILKRATAILATPTR